MKVVRLSLMRKTSLFLSCVLVSSLMADYANSGSKQSVASRVSQSMSRYVGACWMKLLCIEVHLC